MLKLIRRLFASDAGGGLVLMAAAVLALFVANSELAPHYVELLETRLSVRFGEAGIAKPFFLWVNDGLMAVFFLMVGLELKREVLEGHLSSWRAASMPVIAAIGGMLLPAAIYAAINRDDPIALHGWAIPTATDIAFALGVLALLGDRVPPALKVLLLSVAVFDDLGAVIIIAAFYTSELSTVSLATALALITLLAVLNLARVTRTGPYIAIGIPLWVAVLKSGVHATLAGVVLAMFIPLRERDAQGFSPLRRLEHALHPWVAFAVLPLFAFTNAGVSLEGLSMKDVLQPVPLGIALGLVLGKQVGVLGSCWLAARLRIAALPDGVGWRHLHGVSLLCGIGFTMSLFIASLAFATSAGDSLNLDRLGILLGSSISGVLGLVALALTKRAVATDA
jgi:NhaA family Na+:H+ antiporter